MACGPDMPAARAAVIGLQLMLQSALGFYCIMGASYYGALLYTFVAIFNALCLMGSNYLFNFNIPIWLLDTNDCNLYFGHPGLNLNRCKDGGYLEWLRVLGVLLILFEFGAAVASIRAYVNILPASIYTMTKAGEMRMDQLNTLAGSTAATGQPASTTVQQSAPYDAANKYP